MRQPKYRLEVVLDARGRKKDEAARFVAVRRQELLQAEDELKRRINFLEDCRRKQKEAHEKMMSEFNAGSQAGNIVAHRNFLQVLKDKEEELLFLVEEQKIEAKKAEERVDEALDLLAEASKELKVIEKHKEKWKEAVKREREKQEQKISDEIGAILHQRTDKL